MAVQALQLDMSEIIYSTVGESVQPAQVLQLYAKAAEQAEAVAAQVLQLYAKANELAALAECRAKGQRQPFRPQEAAAVKLLLEHGLLADTTPREVKRLLNRYLLAQCCLEAQVSVVGSVERRHATGGRGTEQLVRPHPFSSDVLVAHIVH